MRQITMKAVLAALLILLAASAVCAAENAAEDEPQKARLWLGVILIAVGLATFMKTDEAVFFIVFASQGVAQLIEYFI